VRRLSGAPVDFEERRRLKEAALARLDLDDGVATSRECRHARIADYSASGGARSCPACETALSPRPADQPSPRPRCGPALRPSPVRRPSRGHPAGACSAAPSSWNRERPWVRELDFFGALPAGRGGGPGSAGRVGERELVLRATGGADARAGAGRAGGARRGAGGEGVLPRLARAARPEGRLRRHAGGAGAAVHPRARGVRRRLLCDLDAAGQLRFEGLRHWRLGLARAEARAAFTIFDDRTLREIADRNPVQWPSSSRWRGVVPPRRRATERGSSGCCGTADVEPRKPNHRAEPGVPDPV